MNRGEAVELASKSIFPLPLIFYLYLRHSKHIGKFPVEREGGLVKDFQELVGGNFSKEREEPGKVVKLGRRSGWLYVALYCKQASTCFMHYSSSTHPKRLTELSVPISLTRMGLSRIIPPFHRKYSFATRNDLGSDPTWKATLKPIRLKGSRRKKGVPSVFRAFPFEIHSRFQLAKSRNQFCGRQQANWLGALWFPWTRSCFDPNNELISQIGCSAFEEAVRVGHPYPEFAEVMPSLGRLGQSIEGGGKRRIFPIGNWVIRCVLHPLHKWCMTVLSTLRDFKPNRSGGTVGRLI
ncbi:hypothetical protein KIW84_070845 [Lathyrus oleraceus]|uniref:Uncharacterized protein n=1 Tax=Pisum sativum TaxID=3888 RepID=A0A9D4VJ44_PEA|nr:hypothetical protein KIW84_070845 [Pisum sativum]